MKETLYDVVSAICEAKPQYKIEHIPVVGRIHGDFNGSERTYWLVVGERNFSMYSKPQLKQYGEIVPRNSSHITRILNTEVGEEIVYPVTLKNKNKTSEMFRNS